MNYSAISILTYLILYVSLSTNILEYSHINLAGFTAVAQFCRVLHEKGGVIIYVQNNLKFTNIDLSDYCKEKDFEACAIKLTITSINICIITIYRV